MISNPIAAKNLFLNYLPLIIFFSVIEIVLKGMALYRSARNGQRVWFVCLLIFNTLGILPLIYLLTNKLKRKK